MLILEESSGEELYILLSGLDHLSGEFACDQGIRFALKEYLRACLNANQAQEQLNQRRKILEESRERWRTGRVASLAVGRPEVKPRPPEPERP